ncbi:MAG: tetratricopeptide repeat protein, partial [Planctomycetota bacterium]
GRLGSARKLLDEAALHSPNSLSILSLQGEVLLELGQWEAAARAFKHLLELEPDCGRAHFGLAQACAGSQSSLEQASAGLDALLEAQKLGLRDKQRMLALDKQLAALVQRFEKGEQPAPGPLIRGSKSQPHSKGADALDPWRGTLIEK